MDIVSEPNLYRTRLPRPAETLSAGSVQVWGESIYYEAAGVAEAGPTILFLHESGGSAVTWHGQVVGLAQAARCLGVDLPGHGRSEGIGCTTVGGYRKAVIGFLDALAIRWPVVVAGVCLGAAVAVDVALHAPGRVAGLVLAGVSEQGRAGDGVRRRTAAGEAPDDFVQGLFSHSVQPRLLHERLQCWRLTSPVVRHGDLTALYHYPMAASMRQLDHPVLLMTGERDPMAPPEMVRALTAGMADVRVVTVPGAGCLSMAEHPALFNEAVAKFLEVRCPQCPVGPEERLSVGYRRQRSPAAVGRSAARTGGTS
jgi:pimeloyl-ACP methyl ester carboxylesterase